jgi:hypothetical protein
VEGKAELRVLCEDCGEPMLFGDGSAASVGVMAEVQALIDEHFEGRSRKEVIRLCVEAGYNKSTAGNLYYRKAEATKTIK